MLCLRRMAKMEFALAIGAYREEADSSVRTKNYQTLAAYVNNVSSEDEAIGAGVRMARKQWPDWYGHWCVACRIPERKES